jgi:HAD superfamily hydrolase (TIGR01509 family)
MSLQALIFDLDGTMADTEERHRQAYEAAFIKLELWWDWGPALYRELLKISGGLARLHHYVEMLRAAAHEKARLHAIVPLIHRTKSELYAEMLRAAAPPLRPGVQRLIGEAQERGLKVAVVTTSASAHALEVLRGNFRRPGIDLLVCADEVARPKPAPDLYRRALALLRIAPEAAIAFEDSANGLRAARAAGLATVLTPSRWTIGQDFVGSAFVLHDLNDLRIDGLLHMQA